MGDCRVSKGSGP
ncbi:hypothetical protein YPPY88_0631, partial [Yersinia pestis PY-88]